MMWNSFKPRLMQTLMAESAPNFGGDVSKIRKGMEADEIRSQRLAESDARRGTPLDPSNPADRQSLLDRRAEQITIGMEATEQARKNRPDLFKETNPLQPENAASMDEERRRRRMKMAGYGTAEAAEY
jgi:hypothetical protein